MADKNKLIDSMANLIQYSLANKSHVSLNRKNQE